jgi:predicted pyridoxine 5'-phosphate oxidase superfamily flavin-nucleotide-binding protein
MEMVENGLDVPIDEFLDRPLFCFLGTVSAAGDPRVSPLWYRWEAGAIWIVGDTERTYLDRVRRRPAVALAVVDADPRAGRVQHVGLRGRGTVEPFDRELVGRLLARYLGDDRAAWDERFVGLDPDRWRLLRVEPETVVARDQSFEPSLGVDASDDG